MLDNRFDFDLSDTDICSCCGNHPADCRADEDAEIAADVEAVEGEDGWEAAAVLVEDEDMDEMGPSWSLYE